MGGEAFKEGVTLFIFLVFIYVVGFVECFFSGCFARVYCLVDEVKETV